MKAYEDNLYEQWRENVESTLSQLLKRNLLVKPHERQPPPAQTVHVVDQDDLETGECGVEIKNHIVFLDFLCR